MRTMIIGDIHGCRGSLDGLLERLQPDPAEDRLVFLGDLFDRGLNSWEVLQEVKSVAERFGERFVLLKGNHEDYLLQPKLSWSQKMIWNRVGRPATVRSFKLHGERMEDSAEWLREHVTLFYRDETAGYQCVHAGVLVEPLEMNDMNTLVHDHDVVLRNCYQGMLTITGHIAVEDPVWFAGDGETAVKLPEGEWRRLPERGVICIDTGCGKDGRLTGMVIDNCEYILCSVPQS